MENEKKICEPANINDWKWVKENPKKYFIGLLIVFIIFFKIFTSIFNQNSSSNNINPTTVQSSQPCSDMESYNQGVSEGRGQRGILIDCDSYYPYEGWAKNKECWCEGFNKGKNQ